MKKSWSESQYRENSVKNERLVIILECQIQLKFKGFPNALFLKNVVGKLIWDQKLQKNTHLN